MTTEPLCVIKPGPKLGNAPMSGPFLIETRYGASVGTANSESNAYLFAAAWEVLEALEGLLADSESPTNRALAKAAIKKAYGA